MAEAMIPPATFVRPFGFRISGVATTGVRHFCVLAGCTIAALFSAIPAAHAIDDDLVPAGIVRFSVATSHETQNKAVARDSVNHGLEVWALPDPSDTGRVAGTLSREINETDLNVQLGITDHWNLTLVLPYVEAIQHSSLQVTDPTADAAFRTAIASLKSKAISGMGNYRFTTSNRPLFTDSNAIIWGLGITGSTERNAGIYTGTGTFQNRDPYGTWLGFFRYSHYPQLARSRIDARVEYQLPQLDHVTLATGERATILGGPIILSSFGWEHEPSAWGYGMRVDQRTTLQTRIDGEAQNDPVKEWIFHAQLSYGNLIALEEAPIRHPYQAQLAWDTTFFAYNAPIRDRWTLKFVTYF